MDTQVTKENSTLTPVKGGNSPGGRTPRRAKGLVRRNSIMTSASKETAKKLALSPEKNDSQEVITIRNTWWARFVLAIWLAKLHKAGIPAASAIHQLHSLSSLPDGFSISDFTALRALAEQQKTTITQLHSELSAKSSDLDSATALIQNLESRIAALESANSSLFSEHDASLARENMLKTRVATLQSDNKRAEAAAQAQDTAAKKLQAELESTAAALADERSATKHLLFSHRKEVSTLCEEHAQAQRDFERRLAEFDEQRRASAVGLELMRSDLGAAAAERDRAAKRADAAELVREALEGRHAREIERTQKEKKEIKAEVEEARKAQFFFLVYAVKMSACLAGVPVNVDAQEMWERVQGVEYGQWEGWVGREVGKRREEVEEGRRGKRLRAK